MAGETSDAGVDEFEGNVQACVELTSTGPLASDTIVSLETRNDSAIGKVNLWKVFLLSFL